MSIAVTWKNVFVFVGLAVALFSSLVAGTGLVIQWRVDAVQRQLSDRMVLFQREMDGVSRRLERLEQRERP